MNVKIQLFTRVVYQIPFHFHGEYDHKSPTQSIKIQTSFRKPEISFTRCSEERRLP